MPAFAPADEKGSDKQGTEGFAGYRHLLEMRQAPYGPARPKAP